MALRLFAVQGAWNYETMLGNGIAFALEPALRRLPGGRRGDAYRTALARHATYFNAHPYLAGIAVGALAHAELAGESVERIERFRTASCSPLGSVGDRLVWAGWLPACSLLALAAFAVGASPWTVVLLFLVMFNVAHVWLRLWGLRVGYRDGLRVAAALGAPVLRQGPAHLSRVVALLGGLALPIALRAELANVPAQVPALAVIAAAAAGAVVLVRLQGRVDGWRIALAGATICILLSMVL